MDPLDLTVLRGPVLREDLRDGPEQEVPWPVSTSQVLDKDVPQLESGC